MKTNFEFKKRLESHHGVVHRIDDRSRTAAYAADWRPKQLGHALALPIGDSKSERQQRQKRQQQQQRTRARGNGEDRIPDQARHHSDRREPRPRPHVRRLQAEGQGPDHLQPAVQGHRQRRRHAGPELRPGAAVLGRGAAVVLYRRSDGRQVALQRRPT